MLPTTLDDLKRIVTEKLEETTHLEFKRELPEPGKNDSLARSLATLANTEGGVIIYGIVEEDGRATALAPIDLKDAPERVGLVAQSVDEPVRLTNLLTIEAEGGHGKGFLVVEVPSSERAPHLYKGAALGGAGRVTVPLSRRQVGEIFARSSGFAQEFGLRLGRPGQILLTLVREPYQESHSAFGKAPEVHTGYRYDLVIENVGETDVFDVDWEWVFGSDDTRPEQVFRNPFPIDVMHPGGKASVHVLPPTYHINDEWGKQSTLKVRTVWRDGAGNQSDRTWPISW